MALVAIRADRAAEMVYQQILADIADFRLLPGDRFTENALSRRFQLSRTPIRDALFQLKHDGYVDVRFRSGWHVMPFDFRRFDELYEMRIVLESAAVERLCQAETMDALLPLDDIWLAPEPARETAPWSNSDLDEGFHRTLMVAAGNKEMAAVHEDVTEKIRIIRRLDFLKTTRVDATYREHAKLLEMIRRRRGPEALILLRAHITQSKQEVRKITVHMMHEARQAVRAHAAAD